MSFLYWLYQLGSNIRAAGLYSRLFFPHHYLNPFFDNILLELGGLPHVLPLAVILDLFCAEQVEGFNSKSLLVFEFVY